MDKLLKTAVFSFLLLITFTSSSAQNCTTYKFTTTNNSYNSCSNLPVQTCFLHWTYHPSNNTVDIAFRHGGVSASDWVCWALNPSKSGMVGSQCLVAMMNSNGAMRAYTSPITSYNTKMPQGPLSFSVPKISAEFNTNEMIIYATLVLPAGRTSFNQVWQFGPVSGGTPAVHSLGSAGRKSRGVIDFVSGSGQTGTKLNVGNARQSEKNVHGVLNTVSWGILMPLGALSARYFKVFKSADPAWFYIHILCQCSGYIVGVAGWATGLKLGSDSVGIQYNKHRNIGIALFCLGTLQVFALLLRPKKDHKYRFYWNIYHHSVGYTVITLSIANIFEGFDILDPAKKWKTAYIGILIFLGVVAAILEAFTWCIVLKRKKENSNKYPHVVNGVHGANGVNGHGDYRSHQVA